MGRENSRACALSRIFITCSYEKDRKLLYAITLTIKKQSARIAAIKNRYRKKGIARGRKV